MLLAFVLIDMVGLSPVQFGMAFLVSVASSVSGALANSWLMRRVELRASISIGMGFILLAGAFYGIGLSIMPAGVVSVMLPAGLWSFGVALVMPAVMMMAMEDFAHMAGSAAALFGFMQMGGGLLGSTAAALLLPDALTAIRVIMPFLAGAGLVLWLRIAARMT
jgi:DHA1 family bicyclomycin/chloramphenicol resistance-like MFS transporter